MNAKPATQRRYDLDWLRVCAVLGVFFFHSLHFFDPGNWSVKNPATYPWVGGLMDVLGLWLMPLIFVISGASIFYASRKGSATGFLQDKVLRLFVPLLVGAFTFSTTQVYVERVSHGQFQGTFFQFLPHYFDGLYFEGGTGNFAFHGMHLWYLLVLFVFTLLLMPLFWWLKGTIGGNVLRRLGDVLALPGAIALLVVPTVALQNITDNGGLGGDFELGGWRLVQYLWFFLAGYLIVSHAQLQQRIIQARWVCLSLSLVFVVLSLAGRIDLDRYTDIAVWPMLLTMLGFAMKHLMFSNRFLAYANEAVLPFYILHQTVLLGVGFFVVSWAIPDLAKYLIIMLTSFVTCVLLYEYLVRRINVLRVLFGLKPLHREKTILKVALSTAKS
jgi:glucans biosynthesis protein C